jgi:hypothetical protein
MHGLTHCNNIARILALDLGKFNSVLCRYDPATHAHQFFCAQTTPQAIHDLLVDHQTGDDPAGTLLVIETCDMAGWVHDIAVALGMSVAVANPAHEAWRWTRVKRKTDKDDALKLAKLTVLGQLPTAHMPSPQQRQRRRLVHYRRVLVDRRTQIKNQVRSIYSQQGLSLPPRGKAWTKIGIKQIAAESRALARCESVDDLWRAACMSSCNCSGRSTNRSNKWMKSSTPLAQPTRACSCSSRSPAWARAWPRRWWPTSMTRTASRTPATSPVTRGWCPSRSKAAR